MATNFLPRMIAIAVVGTSAFFGSLTPMLAADKVTFSETIAPILYDNCVTCHRPGEAAPFSLISYDDARKRGALIAKVTQSPGAAGAVAGFLLLAFYSLWFGVSVWRRK